jgi:hypothetical protein
MTLTIVVLLLIATILSLAARHDLKRRRLGERTTGGQIRQSALTARQKGQVRADKWGAGT